jgi:hypothetical protein
VRKLISFAAILIFCPFLHAQQELDNASIIKMVKAGLSAEIVVATVRSQPGHYDVTADGLIALKKAGATDPIISAMITRGSAPSPAAAGSGAPDSPAMGASAVGANGLPAGVDSVGMYYKDKDGNWTEMGVEVVNFKTGGALKHIGSAGIVKEDLNGHVGGYHSRLMLPNPAEFMLYVPEGTSPGEYQLIHFRTSSDSREFRSLTGGVAHASGGAVRDTVDFNPKKVAPRLYSITLSNEIGKGEFGFLPPVDTSTGKSVNSSGKIYTFAFGG